MKIDLALIEKVCKNESDLDNYNVDDFVSWHNENWVTQIKRVFVEVE